jgi:glutathione S-transferase
MAALPPGSTPILAYWNIRGLAHPIRLQLKYMGVSYQDRFYNCGNGPNYERTEWLTEKGLFAQQKTLDFPNLPYYMEGNDRLTQSTAIMRFIARKHMPELLGNTLEEQTRCDIAFFQAVDIYEHFTEFAYSPAHDVEQRKAALLQALPRALKEFENFLGNRKWFAGEQITIADFKVYSMIDVYRYLNLNLLPDFPKLASFMQRFEELKGVKEYVSSDELLKLPLNNKMAQFGHVPMPRPIGH